MKKQNRIRGHVEKLQAVGKTLFLSSALSSPIPRDDMMSRVTRITSTRYLEMPALISPISPPRIDIRSGGESGRMSSVLRLQLSIKNMFFNRERVHKKALILRVCDNSVPLQHDCPVTGTKDQKTLH